MQNKIFTIATIFMTIYPFTTESIQYKINGMKVT